jgi:hypothetical protein
MSYASYTQQSNGFLRRSRQHLTDGFLCVCFVTGLSNFHLHAHLKSYRSLLKGCNMPLAKLPSVLHDLVTDSPHPGRAKVAHAPSDNLGGSRPSKKRSLEKP